MKNAKLFVVSTLIVGLVVLMVVSSAITRNVKAQRAGPEPLLGASPEEVGQAALEQIHPYVIRDTPTVLLTLPVTREQLPSLELNAVEFGCQGEEPPLMLVALKGEFDVNGLIPNPINKPWYVRYIVYVFDLTLGGPFLIQVSPDGSDFAKLLNVPTSPQEPPTSESDLSVVPADQPVISTDAQLPCGSVEPTLAPNDIVP